MAATGSSCIVYIGPSIMRNIREIMEKLVEKVREW